MSLYPATHGPAAGSGLSPSPATRLAHKAWRLLHTDAGAAYELIEEAHVRAEDSQDALGQAWAQLVRGFHRLSFASPSAAATELSAARTRFAQLQERGAELLAVAGLARALWRQGQVQRAADLLHPLRDEALRTLRREQLAIYLNALAGCHSARGESEQAMACMAQALREAGPKRGLGYDVALHANLSHELLELGDLHEALRQIERGLERIHQCSHGRAHTVLLVNRVVALTGLGRAREALPNVHAIANAQPDGSGRGLLPMHFEALALCALRAGTPELAQDLMARVNPTTQLPDDRLELGMAQALATHLRGDTAGALVRLQVLQDACERALGDARPGMRLRCDLAELRAELLEASGDAPAALAALHSARALQAERAARASAARQQAALLQTELMQLRLRLEEQERRHAEAERARAVLAEVNQHLQRKISEVEALQVQLRQQATQDALTGLANRRQLNETLPAQLALALREQRPLAVAILDLDHFKQVNDTHGHPVGDQLLAALGALLRQRLRRSDLAFRYGGEEFCLLLPNTPALDAQRMVAELLEAWRTQVFELEGGGQLGSLSFSAGVTDSLQAPPSPAGLLRAADQLLLLAKRSRRGSVLLPGAAEALNAV
ncbi:diguanylate cyclase [Inhella sp.]|uniref:diguanylate cyclase n=1 Tax=Inhella sp. TaxID=1921806 RepID=UPI0035AE3DA4